jgi:hypothetical protein
MKWPWGPWTWTVSPFGQVAQVIGEEAAFDAVDAEIEAVSVGGGGDGVGPGLRFAAGSGGYGGEELAGGEDRNAPTRR